MIKVAGRDALKRLLSAHKGVVLQFSASWCGPCKAFRPAVETAARSHPEIKFLSADIDESPELAEEYGVASVPATFFFLDGQRHEQLAGSDAARLNAILKGMRARASPAAPQ